jgi:hypothetical protein
MHHFVKVNGMAVRLGMGSSTALDKCKTGETITTNHTSVSPLIFPANLTMKSV